MSVDRKEIDLIIRAAIQGGKNLDGVTKSINDIEKALAAQADAAKRGESSIDDLKATLLALQKVQDQLKDQAGLIGQFDKLAKQIETQVKKVDAAGKAHLEYKDKLDKAGKATEFQSNKLIKLADAAERNQATLVRQRADQEALSATLQDAGIAVNDLANAEDKARKAAAQLGITINNTHQAIATYSDDVRQARDREREWADSQAFEKKRKDALNLFKAAEYAKLFGDMLDKLDMSEKQVQINSALRKTADEAIAAARGYRTLGTAAKTLSGSSNSLRDLITGIVNPSEQARATLGGIESEIKAVGNAAASAKGPIEGYRDLMVRLTAAQREIGNKAAMVDTFNQQVQALKSARSEFSAARAQVLQYAEALRNSSGENKALENSLKSAQATLAAAQRRLESQLQTVRGLRESMRQAGLSTKDLAATENTLVTAARNAVVALKSLTDANGKYADSTVEAKKAQDLFTSSGRTTLSFFQRMRGEALSLITTYVGLYAAISGAQSVLEAYNKKQAILSQLSLVVGNDQRAIGDEYSYVRGQSQRLGAELSVLSENYAKFATGAKLAGRSTQESKYIFESFAETGSVLKLSGDKMQQVFKALTDMMSKGQIGAEELKGQLGDAIPGAFAIFQEALKSKFPDLNKAMEGGKVGIENLVEAAEFLRLKMATALPSAINSLQASQNRLNTEFLDFKVLIADSGFADEYKKLVELLTTFFKSEDGKQFAKNLSDGLSGVVKALTLIIENSQLLKEILIAGLLLAGARLAGAFLIALVKLPGALKSVEIAAVGAAGAVSKLNYAFIGLTSFMVGWDIGAILREKFVAVRQWGVGVVFLFETLRVGASYSMKIMWEEIGNVFADSMSSIGNLLTSWFRQALGIFSTAARAMGKGEFADEIDKAIESITLKTNRTGNASAKLRQQMMADLKAVRKISEDMMRDAERIPAVVTQKNEVSPTAKPVPGSGGKPKVDEKAAAARINAKEQLENELLAIEAKIEKNEKDSLERRLKGIDLSYQKLLKKIKDFGGAEAAGMEAQLTKSINELKLQETNKFNDQLLAEQQAIQSKLEQIEAAGGRKEKTDLQARLDAVRSQYEKQYRDIQDLKTKLFNNKMDTAPADAMKTRLDLGIEGLQNLERQAFFEDSINKLLEERKAKLDTIAIQEKVGLITSTDANQQATDVINTLQPQIEKVAADGTAYANAMITAAEATGANVIQMEAMKAKMAEAVVSGQGLTKQAQLEGQLRQNFANGATTAFGNMADNIGQALAGMKSWKEAIQSTRDAFLGFAADFLKQIAMMIIQQIILNSLKNSSGGVFGSIANTIVGTKHTGGVIGAPGGTSRMANPDWFIGAPKYHGGGIAGLAPDEYPTILKKNEEVLTQNDPRNVLNGGATQQRAQDIKIINTIDSGSVVSEGLSSQSGSRAIINFISANRTEVKAMLGV